MNRPDVSVLLLVPDAEAGHRLEDRVRPVLDGMGLSHEIVCVETASGYGAALREGIAACTGEWVLTIDEPFVHLPQTVRTLWRNREGADLLLASRAVRGGGARTLSLRSLGRSAVHRLLAYALHLPFRDLTCGFRLCRRRALDEVRPEGKGIDVSIDLSVRIHCRGWVVREVPFIDVPGKERRGFGHLVADAFRCLAGAHRYWTIRNDAHAADYEERAIHSRIPLQRYWQRQRKRLVDSMVDPSGRILDIGCGSSRIARTLPDLVAVDRNIASLRYLYRAGLPVAAGDVFALPFRDGAFDQVIFSMVIEHLPEGKGPLREIARVLKPGGTLVIGTPDHGSRLLRILEWFYNRIVPHGHVSEHINYYTRDSLRKELVSLGFAVERIGTVLGAELLVRVRRPPEGSDAT